MMYYVVYSAVLCRTQCEHFMKCYMQKYVLNGSPDIGTENIPLFVDIQYLKFI